jgi:hypothetical protein
MDGSLITRGYTHISADARDTRSATQAVAQVILEADRRNVSAVYDASVAAVKGNKAGDLILPLPDPGIGDQSMAWVNLQTSPGFTLPMTGIVFRKGNIVEMLFYLSSPPDYGGAVTLAKSSAAWIPPEAAALPRTTTGFSEAPVTTASPTRYPAGTPAPLPPDSEIHADSLTSIDMPFTVRTQTSFPPGLPVDSSPAGDFGLLRGLGKSFSDKEETATGSPHATTVVYRILEYPPGNVTRAYQKVSAGLPSRVHPPGSYTLLFDPGIGDESFSAIINDSTMSSSGNPVTVVVFRKGNYLEILMVTSAKPTATMAAILARGAADRI